MKREGYRCWGFPTFGDTKPHCEVLETLISIAVRGRKGRLPAGPTCCCCKSTTRGPPGCEFLTNRLPCVQIPVSAAAPPCQHRMSMPLCIRTVQGRSTRTTGEGLRHESCRTLSRKENKRGFGGYLLRFLPPAEGEGPLEGEQVGEKCPEDEVRAERPLDLRQYTLAGLVHVFNPCALCMTAQIPPEEEALLGPPPPLKHAASSPGLPRHGTWLTSSLILFNSILGSGVLAIPWAMSQVEGSWTHYSRLLTRSPQLPACMAGWSM